MPNTDNPNGFRPWGAVLSIKKFEKDSSAARVFRWDVIEIEADGGVIAAAAGQTALVGTAAAGSAASTADDLMVYDDPDQKFEAQDDADGATSAQTNAGNMADHLATTGSTTTGISAHEIDISSAGTSAAGFLLLDLVNRPGNAWGVNADIVVNINEHLRGQIGRAGI